MASTVMGPVGASIGSLAGGTFGWTASTWSSIGWTAGVLAANYLFAPDGPDIMNEGPRLDDLNVTSSSYGVDIFKVFGAFRTTGNIIWSLPLIETRHEEKQESSGKGGGGGGSETTVWYTYKANFAVALCEGEVTGVRKVWAGAKLIYDVSTDASLSTKESSSIQGSNFTIYRGTSDQEVDWRMQAHDPDTPAYRNICYIQFHDFELEDYSNIIPNITAEVVKAGSLEPSIYTLYEAAAIGGTAYSNINGHFSKVWDSDDSYHFTYTNGADGTYSRAYYHSSSYYNKGDDGISSYSAGTLGIAGTCSGFWTGRSAQTATLVKDNDNYKPVTKRYLNSATVVYHVHLARGFGRPISMRSSVDSIDKDCFCTEDFATGTSTLRTASFFVSGIEGQTKWEKYNYYPATGEHYIDVVEDYVIYKPDPDYFDIGSTEAIVRGQDVYAYTTRDSGAPESPCIYKPKELLYRQFEFGFGGQDVIIDKNVLSTLKLFYVDILGGIIYCFVELDTGEYYLRKYSTAGVYIEDIDLDALLNIAGLGGLSVYESSARTGCKLEVDSNGIFLALRIGDGSYSFFYLSGDPSVTGQTFEVKELAHLPNGNAPINGSYYGGISFSSLFGSDTGYNPATNTFKMLTASDEYIIYFDNISSTTIYLSEIIRELLEESGYSLNDFDLSEGAATEVQGYVIPRNMSARAAIEPLLSAYDFSFVEKGFKLYLLNNQKNSIIEIPEEDLGANTESKIEYRTAQENALLKKLTVNYANRFSDYQISVQSSSRTDTNTINERYVELPMALSDNEAKRISERNLYYNWLIRESYKFSLPSKYMMLDTNDIVTINYDGYKNDVKLTRVIITEDNIINCDAINSLYSVHESNAIGQDTGINGGSVIEPIDESVFEILNTHTLNNTVINDSGMYAVSSGKSNSWTGSNFYSKSTENDDFTTDIALLGASHIGQSYGGFGDASVHDWDYVNIISVSSDHDLVPTSTTKDDVIGNGVNYIVVGNEILQYVTATEVSENRYELSTLLRGRRGTESETSSHTDDREVFVYLNYLTTGFISKDIGTNDYYMAVSLGLILNDTYKVKQQYYDGKNLKPFSPSYFKGERSGTDINLQWMRRSRYISGYFKTLPLSESSELYTIEVYNNADVLIRTITGSTTSSYTYDITLDAFTVHDNIKFKVYQISSVVGKGYESDYLLIQGL